MSKKDKWVIGLLALLAIVLSACGLGPNPVPPGGGPGQVEVVLPGATNIHYDDGSGSWQTAQGTNFSFTPNNPGGAYRVAFQCTGGSTTVFNIYAATQAELPRIYDPCPSAATPVSFSVQYATSSLPAGTTAVRLAHKAGTFYHMDAVDSPPTGTIQVSTGIAGTQDLVLLAEGSGGLLAYMYLPNVNVYSGLSLTANNPWQPVTPSQTFPDPSTFPGYVSGWTYGWSVHGVTPNHTIVLSDTDTTGDMNYYPFPFATRYLFQAYATDTTRERLAYFRNKIGATPPAAMAFPGRLNAVSFNRAGGTFQNLPPSPPDTRMYEFAVSWWMGTQHYSRIEQVSAGFLGTSGAYTLQSTPSSPQWSAASGYQSSSGSWGVERLEANKTLAELMQGIEDHGPRGIFLVPDVEGKWAMKWGNF